MKGKINEARKRMKKKGRERVGRILYLNNSWAGEAGEKIIERENEEKNFRYKKKEKKDKIKMPR